jgi:murein DD-endopeptidase MepM/ murein hydrolase activator NlpD
MRGLLLKIKYSANIYRLYPLIFLILAACAGPVIIDTPTMTINPPTQTQIVIPDDHVEYITQSGDTLKVVATHFGVDVEQIISTNTLINDGLLDPGERLWIPEIINKTTSSERLIPDSDVIFSSSATNFNLSQFLAEYEGHLKNYSQVLNYGPTSGVQIIEELARDYSINPRVLLTLLEYFSGWVRGEPKTKEEGYYPFGFVKSDRVGLYRQTSWVIRQLMDGYYGWRAGTVNEVTFADKSSLRLSPNLNAGTVAVMYYLAQLSNPDEWQVGLKSIAEIHTELFGDPWKRAQDVEPLFPDNLKQPELRLPFPDNQTWNYTCGPHVAWGRYGNQPLAALDFAPPLDRPGCGNSVHWALAIAPGLVVRAGNGAVVVDVNYDGDEHTGWVILYMHIANTGRIEVGERVNIGDRIGHPSCEGGSSTGIHVHVARKYNGEWVLADGGLPFVLSGFRAENGEGFCGGRLVRNNRIVEAYPWGSYKTKICQPELDVCATPTPTNTPTHRPTKTATPTRTPKATQVASLTPEDG